MGLRVGKRSKFHDCDVRRDEFASAWSRVGPRPTRCRLWKDPAHKTFVFQTAQTALTRRFISIRANLNQGIEVKTLIC